MEYFENFKTFIENTAIFRDVISTMPEPFNNAYFDIILGVVLMGILFCRSIDFLRMRRRHKKLRIRQEEERLQSEADRQLREEEARIQQGKLAAFIRFMEMQMKPKSEGYEDSGTKSASMKLSGRQFRIESRHTASDFERLMEEAKRENDV